MEQKKLDRMAKQVLPDSFKLESDRGRNAKVVLNPDKPKEFKRWKDATNKTDLKGFDTKKEKEKSIREINKSLHLGYIESDPERFVREGHETRRLIDSVKDKIFDKESMIKAVSEVWKKESSLKSFWKEQDWIKKRDWEALFNTSHLQSIIKQNSVLPLVKMIQKQYNINVNKAQAIYDKLPQRKKNQLIQKHILGIKKPKTKTIKVKKARPIFDSLPKAKRQKSKAGTYYIRTKPQKWSAMQQKFLKNNQNQKVDDLVRIYNNTFSAKRTKSSLYTKLYRLKKETRSNS